MHPLHDGRVRLIQFLTYQLMNGRVTVKKKPVSYGACEWNACRRARSSPEQPREPLTLDRPNRRELFQSHDAHTISDKSVNVCCCAYRVHIVLRSSRIPTRHPTNWL